MKIRTIAQILVTAARDLVFAALCRLGVHQPLFNGSRLEHFGSITVVRINWLCTECGKTWTEIVPRLPRQRS